MMALVPNLIAIAIILTVIFSMTFGSQAERLGAAVLGVGTTITWVAQGLWGTAPLLAFFTIDLLMACGFGVITFRHPEKLWPGIAGCAQLLVFVFSATRALDFPLSESAYLLMLSVVGLAVTVAVAGGTVRSRWMPRQPSDWDLAYARIT